MRREIECSDLPVGLLALVDGVVAGWSRVVPRASLPGIVENRALARLLDDAGDASWWVSCFVVRPEHRGRGIGVALLRGATEWAFQHGASLVDGHPVDVDTLRGSPAPSAIFTGTVSMFERAGFSEIGRTYPSRPVMRRLRSGADCSTSSPQHTPGIPELATRPTD